jgi:hypothetical protein
LLPAGQGVGKATSTGDHLEKLSQPGKAGQGEGGQCTT